MQLTYLVPWYQKMMHNGSKILWECNMGGGKGDVRIGVTTYWET